MKTTPARIGRPRRPMVSRTCRQCSRAFEQHPYDRVKEYCSRTCSGLARRQREARSCRACGAVFEVEPGRLASGRGQYCSAACAQRGQWGARVLVTCRQCGQQRERSPSYADRPYCSQACYFASRGWRQRVAHACPTCGTVRQVYGPALARGIGKFCGRACYVQSRRRPRAAQACAQCKRRMQLLPCQRRRRFCSRACYLRAHIPRRFRCQACRQSFLRPAWRRPQFCSPACAHQGRGPLGTREDDLPRNRRIVELGEQGLRSPAIQQRLYAESKDWWMSPAAIRQVLSRVRRGAHERIVTLRG